MTKLFLPTLSLLCVILAQEPDYASILGGVSSAISEVQSVISLIDMAVESSMVVMPLSVRITNNINSNTCIDFTPNVGSNMYITTMGPRIQCVNYGGVVLFNAVLYFLAGNSPNFPSTTTSSSTSFIINGYAGNQLLNINSNYISAGSWIYNPVGGYFWLFSSADYGFMVTNNLGNNYTTGGFNFPGTNQYNRYDYSNWNGNLLYTTYNFYWSITSIKTMEVAFDYILSVL